MFVMNPTCTYSPSEFVFCLRYRSQQPFGIWICHAEFKRYTMIMTTKMHYVIIVLFTLSRWHMHRYNKDVCVYLIAKCRE